MNRTEIMKWQDILINAKPGEYCVSYHQYMENPKVDHIFKASQKNLWVGAAPGFGSVVYWTDVLEIYTKEDYPEYFL